MTATNHALSGALIYMVLPLPIAIPVAFISHFVLDSLPHYGVDHNKRNTSGIYKAIVYSDTAVALTLGIVSGLAHKWGMLACGVVAYSPDATLVYYYLKHNRTLDITSKSDGLFFKLHLGIQTERPWGIFPELALMITMLAIYIVNF